MKFIPDYVYTLQQERQNQYFQEYKASSDRCNLRIQGLQQKKVLMQKQLQGLVNIATADQDSNDLPLLTQQEHKEVKHSPQKIRTKKAVHVTACHFNEQIGLCGIALIDKEIKVYNLKHNGAKLQLAEVFSFVTQFQSGAFASCLQIEYYVSNGRPIVCLGSSQGDIAIYYLDDDKSVREARGGPTLVLKFNFGNRAQKPDKGELDFDSDDEVPQKQVRLSFRVNERSFYEPSSNIDQTKKSDKLSSLQMITDEYWETVIMNAKDKSQGLNGIELWNIVHPLVQDYEQTSIVVKELSEINVQDADQVATVAKAWIVCLRISGGVIEDALRTFKAEIKKQYANFFQSERSKHILKRIQSESQKPSMADRKNSIVSTIQYNQSQNMSKFDRRSSYLSQYNSKQIARVNSNDIAFNKSEVANEVDHNKVSQQITKLPITALKYVKDVGLIVATFDGQIKIFDAFNFYLVWKNTNKQRTPFQHTSITSFDVSPQLGLLVTAGVEGRIVLIDPFAHGIINQSDVQPNVEILKVFIYTSQQQIITVGKDRTIILLDAYRLEKLQTIKDLNAKIQKFSSVAFDEKSGQLFVGCQKLNLWQAEIDCNTEIQALQVQTLTNQSLREDQNANLLNQQSNLVQSQGSLNNSRNSSVLMSKNSQLVEILINLKDPKNLVIVVDSDNLIRGWSMIDFSTTFSYKAPLKSRITAAATDIECKYIAVGSSNGEVIILNFSSGGLLYNLPHQEQEITCLKFLTGLGEFWLVAGTWSGKMVLWTEPSEDNNFKISAKCRIGHRGDMIVVDSDLNNIVTGGTDGMVTIWNQFSGVRKFAIALPDPVSENLGSAVSLQSAKKISDVLFHPQFTNIVCVMQDSGNVHLFDISNGQIVADYVALMKPNSSWACDSATNRLFVIGEMGGASLFEINIDKQSKYIPDVVQINSATFTNTSKIYKGGAMKEFKWKMLTPWFKAYVINPSDQFFVQSVKFAKNVNLFVTATSNGVVKLFQNNNNATFVGTLNSKDWNFSKMMPHIQPGVKTVQFKQDEQSSNIN